MISRLQLLVVERAQLLALDPSVAGTTLSLAAVVDGNDLFAQLEDIKKDFFPLIRELICL